MILNMISRNTDNFTGFVFQGEEKIYFHAQDKVFNFITEGVGILAEFSKNVMKSPEHFLYGYSSYQIALYTGYDEREISANYNTIILDGSIPDKDIKRMIAESYDLVSDSPTKRIYSAVKKIPRGCVATYGQIAELAGDRKMARAVGNALHKNPDPENIPCYRVVNSKGELSGEFAFGGAGKQAELLEADGVEVINGKVDLKKYGMNIYL